MRKLLYLSFILCFAAQPFAYAKKDSDAKKKMTAEEKKRDEMAKRIREKQAELNGKEWKIEIKSQSGKGDLAGSDVLTFQDNLFKSKNATKLGFQPTNYTLTVSESETGPTVWETMQTNKDGLPMFWRGEWIKDIMSGVINRQLEKGNEEYFFSSSSMKKIPATKAEEEAEAKKKEAKENPKRLASKEPSKT